LIAVADTGSRGGADWAYALFWTGLLAMFVPIAARLASSRATRYERIALIVALGIGLYLVKVMVSPNIFTLTDESAHWRTAADIVRTGHLFAHNPLLPVSPFYPGLESTAAALVNVSGLPMLAAARVIIMAARLILVVALFFLYEQVTGSPRIAGIGALLYMGNPEYLLFDSQFSYESLALPMATLVVLALARRTSSRARRLGFTVVGLVALGTVVVTHHMTTYMLAIFLVVWTGAVILRRNGAPVARMGPGGAALLAIAAALSWLLYAATLTVGYLSPQLRGAVAELLRLIAGEMTGRQLFRTSAGQVAPAWERVTAFTAVALLLVGLLVGIPLLWRRYRTSPLALALLAAGLLYPASLASRLTQSGAEASNRSSGFIFVGLALVAAVGIVNLLLAKQRDWGLRHVLTIGVVVTVLTGGVIVGSPPWARVPGSYLVGGDTRSIDAKGIAAASWARVYLGPDNRLVADRTNAALMGTYGQQRPITGYGDREYAYVVFFANSFGPAEEAAIRHAGVRYIVVDLRLSTALPLIGAYYEIGEPGAKQRSTPIDRAALAKFDGVAGLNRIFDSGDIVIYDASELGAK
jgi:hypothetical protein